jgi:hypothetical protein
MWSEFSLSSIMLCPAFFRRTDIRAITPLSKGFSLSSWAKGKEEAESRLRFLRKYHLGLTK